jgi:HK97 family phage portal protein
MGILQRWAAEWGAAVGSYQRSVRQARRPAFLGSWAESEKHRGDNLTPRMAQRRAMLNSWAYTAVQFIMREASAANFEVTQLDAAGEALVQPRHPVTALMLRPNPIMGRAFLWQYTIAWLQLSGNAYWFVACDNQNTPVELWPLPAQDVEPVPGDAERFIDYYDYTANGSSYHIPAEVMVHFRLPNPFDVFRGLSPLSAAMLATDSDTAMARWNAQFFSQDNVMPSAIINMSSGDPAMPVNPADAEALKADLRAGYQASRRKTAITAAYKLDVALLGWSAREMDFISGRQFTKEEIYSIFGMPGGLLDKNATEANATVADQIFKEKTVWPLLNLIAEQLTAELLIPFYGPDYVGRFEDIRPRNRELELQEVDRAKGALTINEVRQQYWRLEPLASGGNKLYGASTAPAFPMLTDPPAPYNAAPEPPTAPPQSAAALGAARATDLRRWRIKATKAVQAGKAQPPFASDFISANDQARLTRLLSTARTPEQVRLIFEIAAKEAPVADDPHADSKQRAASKLERDLLAYFGGLEKRIIEAVANG